MALPLPAGDLDPVIANQQAGRSRALAASRLADLAARRASPRRFSVSEMNGAVLVAIHGLMDRSSSLVLAQILEVIIVDRDNPAVVVDLAGMQISDLSVLGVLSEAAVAAARRGGSVTLTDPSGPVRRALTHTAWPVPAQALP